MADELKTQRSIAKRKVTTGLRKLAGYLQFGADGDKVVREVTVLEETVNDLRLIHLEYEEKTDTIDEDYLKQINEAYTEVMTQYYSSKKEEQRIKMLKEATPVLRVIENTFRNINLNIDRLERASTLGVNEFNIYAVEVDSETMEEDLNTLEANISKVSGLVNGEDKQDMWTRQEHLITKAKAIKRSMEICIE